MLTFCTVITFVNILLCFDSVSAASSTQLIYCRSDEVMSNCHNDNCVRRYCIEKEPESDCEFKDGCVPGCFCKKGYLYALNGTCIPQEECPEPMVCGENEEYTSCVNFGCPDSKCSDVGRWERCRSLFPEVCIPGCVCKFDYLQAANGTCVLRKDCPKNEICSRDHEYYDLCTPFCPSRSCDRYDSEAICPPQLKPGDPGCYASCQCKEGFFSNYNRDCVPYEHCSTFCFKINEHFAGSPETCEPQTCDVINNTTDRALTSSNTTCKSECRCLPGFVRNKHGECIAKENCDKCLGPNEYFACKKPCDNVCATLHQMNQTNCPYMKRWASCVDMCYCDDGHARDSNNICIPISDCPKK